MKVIEILTSMTDYNFIKDLFESAETLRKLKGRVVWVEGEEGAMIMGGLLILPLHTLPLMSMKWGTWEDDVAGVARLQMCR